MPRPTYGAPTSRPWKRYLLPGGGFIALVLVVAYINASVDSASYPFHVWRMDLDDFVANTVLVVGAIAGIWKVKLRGSAGGSDWTQHALPDMLLRFGLTARLELRLGWPGYVGAGSLAPWTPT